MAQTAGDIAESKYKETGDERWSEGGFYKTLLHAAGAAIVAQIGNGEGLDAALGAAASQLAAGKVNEFAREIAKGMSDDPAQIEFISNILKSVISSGIGYAAGGESGASLASDMDRYNRQLHPEERDWINANYKKFAEEQGIPEEEALLILMRQANKQIDVFWASMLLNYNDPAAVDFLKRFETKENVSWDVNSAFNNNGLIDPFEFNNPLINLAEAAKYSTLYRDMMKGIPINDSDFYWLKSRVASGNLLPVNPDDLNANYVAEGLFGILETLYALTMPALKARAHIPPTEEELRLQGEVAEALIKGIINEGFDFAEKYAAILTPEVRRQLEAVYGTDQVNEVLRRENYAKLLTVVAGAGLAKRATTTAKKTGGVDIADNLGKDVPYDPKSIRASFVEKYGEGNAVSTTVPPSNKPNVKLSGQKHPVTGIPFDERGFPIFDDVAYFDTRLPNYQGLSYKGQMQAASRDLWDAINRGEISASQFTPTQLKQLKSGKANIKGFTWHHHQDSGRMQLIRTDLHKKTGHIGGEVMQKGK